MWPLSRPNTGFYLFENQGRGVRKDWAQHLQGTSYWRSAPPDPGSPPFTDSSHRGLGIPLALHVSAEDSVGDSLLLGMQMARWGRGKVSHYVRG